MFESDLLAIIRKFRRGAAKALLGGVVLSLAGAGLADNFMNEFPIALSNPSRPEGITYGADGKFWFAEFTSGYIGQLDPSDDIFTGQIQLLPNAMPFGIVSGPDGMIYFTESGINGIGQINPANLVYGHSNIPTPNCQPWTITKGPDGNLWFIEFSLNKIAAFNPHQFAPGGNLPLVHEYGPFGNSSQMYGLVAGPDGRMWFTEGTQNVIACIDTNGSNYAQFQLAGGAEPVSIVNGPDGALWFTEYDGGNIGRITTNGAITEFPVPTSIFYTFPRPDGIIAGNDGNLWFTEFNGSAIGRVTTNGIFTLFNTISQNAQPTYLATGVPNVPANVFETNIWFGEYVSMGSSGLNDNIGKLTVSQALTLSGATNLPITGNLFTGTLATFQNSNPTNNVIIYWGDGTSDNFTIIDNNTVVVTNSFTNADVVSISNTMPIGYDTNGLVTNNGTYVITANHIYVTTNTFAINLSVTDSSNDMAFLNISASAGPAFFAGGFVVNQYYSFLTFPDGTNFGYYSMLSFPYVYHADLGYEYFVDDVVNPGACYLYDFKANHWWWTSRTVFPFIYDFSLTNSMTHALQPSWLYYAPNTNDITRYTTNPRYFYDFAATNWITQ